MNGDHFHSADSTVQSVRDYPVTCVNCVNHVELLKELESPVVSQDAVVKKVAMSTSQVPIKLGHQRVSYPNTVVCAHCLPALTSPPQAIRDTWVVKRKPKIGGEHLLCWATTSEPLNCKTVPVKALLSQDLVGNKFNI
ncbi:UNVERIFIED_CONTAM: hypothetical protein FKN15_060110 [Acipenser sinensis]